MAKKKKTRSTGKNVFSIAAKNKSFRAAKRAEAKAKARKKAAWKKAMATAKRKVRTRKRK